MTTPGTVRGERDRRAPGRPRSARADEAIVEAVLDMFAAGHTVDTISIEAIAARAGVGKATIYRRWPNKDALIVDAVATMKGPVPPVRGERVREDLITLLGQVVEAEHGQAMRIVASLIPQLERSESLRWCLQGLIEPRREAMRQVLLRGVRSGELRADLDVELALSMLASPVLVHGMLQWNPRLDPDDLPVRVVDLLLAGIEAR